MTLRDGPNLETYLETRLNLLTKFVEDALTATDLRYQQRFEATEKAIAKAESATEKRFEGVNEFRNQLGDQQRTFMPRSEVEVIHRGINEKIETLGKTVSDRRAQGLGVKDGWGYAVGVVGFVLALLSLIAWVLKIGATP